jgi:predicted nucleic acid-binding Zn ribbon protein
VRPFALIVEINLVEEERYMFCPECGKTNDEDSKFCQNCGSALSVNQGGILPGSKKKLLLILIVVLLAVIAGIAYWSTSRSSLPSADDLQRIIQEQINKESQGRIKLISFQKTNAQEGELHGVKLYNIEYQIEIEFTENCKWVMGHEAMLGGPPQFRTSKPKSQGFWDEWTDNLNNPGKLVKKGHKERISGSLTFEKTEKGWRVAKF